jgi:flagellar basal-body rod modification protein FlgD
MSTSFSPSIANILNPTMNSVLATAKAAATNSSSTSSTSSTSGLADTTTGQTFLNLLVKELQNQDPTAPMDSTAMVGQMISLNQLDQLISINQVLGAATTASPSSTSPVSGASANATQSSAAVMAARAALLNGSSTLTPAQAATLAASDPSTTLDLSNLNNSFGGK